MNPLPYDMGNAGDLLKHGMLAEWTRWWFKSHESMTFLDPFGGRPWVEPPVREVTRRVRELAGTALAAAQPEPGRRYYGSGHVVRLSAEASGHSATVLVSDREAGARRLLVDSGLKAIEQLGFNCQDAYSILDAASGADLILIDPFKDFLEQAAEILPRIAAAAHQTAVLLFVLEEDPDGERGRAYTEARDKWLPNATCARCPRLHGGLVRGEGKYEAELVLAVPECLRGRAHGELVPALQAHSRKLADVLGTAISFKSGAARQDAT